LCPTGDLPCAMRVAAVQTTAGPDRQRNLEEAGALVDSAARAGAELVVVPEYFSVAGDPDHLRRNAESLAGPTVTWASDLSRRLGIRLVAGSFPEAPAVGPRGDGRLFNTSCLIGPSGSIDAVYRKIHLFDVTVAGADSRESATIAPGDQLCVSPLERPTAPGPGPTPVLGLSLCYDLRFPEIYRIMTLLGATVMAVPAAFTAATGPAHWEVLVRARALENQVYVIAAGQVGPLPPGMPACHGHSMIVDPWGSVMAERRSPGPGVVVADLDVDRQRQIRTELPVLANRRPDAYRWPDDESRGEVESGR
jgi:deaminated glutathione amidase